MVKTDRKKLQEWQERLERNKSLYEAEIAKMDQREAMYRGSADTKAVTRDDRAQKTPHVRNIVAEIVEAQVNSSIPQPKVTARRKKDEKKAKLIEDMLRGELDRIPFEMLNDMQERTVPIQGGGFFLVEWDNTEYTHTTVGELMVSALHPKQVIPQDGVYTGIEDMDYIFLRVPQTKAYIKRRYGVDVEDETELEPEIKGADGDSPADDLVTQYIAYYRNDKGGVGLYSWVGDTQLEDLEDYQARRLPHCTKCGATKPVHLEPAEPTLDGSRPELPAEREPGSCPYCGSDSWEETEEEFEEIYVPIHRSDGSTIPGAHVEMVGLHSASAGAANAAYPSGHFSFSDKDPLALGSLPGTEAGMAGLHSAAAQGSLSSGEGIELEALGAQLVPTRIPFYKPDIFPVFLQRNVSVFRQFLGDSDVDKVANQQNTTNRIERKIIDKLVQSGSYMTLPDDASIKVDTDDMKVIRPGNAATKNLIDVYDLQGNIQQDMAYLHQIYEEARQMIGITDSFQGRADRTATSGKAKEFSAAQAAGRMESKRVMKDAAYAALFEAMFKFKLAYADEPRPVLAKDIHGNTEYAEFNRYDFLEQDDAGEWFWNDQFLFSCDTTAPLANNREAMWQETRMNLQTGAYGDPTNTRTLILFWTKMELLHYPGAAETRSYLEEELRQQEMMAAQQRMMQQQAMQNPMMQSGVPAGAGQIL